MICIEITSGLGNQIFQFAFIYVTSLKLRTEYYLDFSRAKKGDLLHKYFQNALIDKRHVSTSIASPYPSLRFFKQTGKDNPSTVSGMLTDDTMYTGYFQSPAYFATFENDIRTSIRLKNKHRRRFERQYGYLKNLKTLVVHVRRTDYQTYGRDELGGKNMCLPDEYFFNCLDQVNNLGEFVLIFVGDDIQYARHTFSSRFPDALFNENHEIIDFQLLLNADMLIISNSTFAWWGAYLNDKKEKVFSPEHWLGFKIGNEYPCSILPDDWIRMKTAKPAP